MIDTIVSEIIEDNTIFLYKGEVNHQMVNVILSNVKRKIKKDIQDIQKRKRFYQIAVECIENVNRHCGWRVEDSHLNELDALFLLKRNDTSLFVICGNIISENEKKGLTKNLDHLLTLSTEELKKAYRKQLMSEFDSEIERGGGAGVGLYDIMLKSDKNIRYHFSSVKDDLSFYLLTVELKLN